jgi:hypothetical protein
VRWAPTPTRAEFRFVPPGHRDARSRLFVRADRVVFEVRQTAPGRAAVREASLSDRALHDQLRAARAAGPLHIPAGADTTLALEMRRFAHDYRRGLPAARAHPPAPVLRVPPSPCSPRGASEAWASGSYPSGRA